MTQRDHFIIMETNHRTKFIHASDIHLGSNQYGKSLRSDDFINALKEILDHAIENSVDFILLGGDVFNSLEMLPSKMTNIFDILMNFKKATNDKVPIIAIEGNHDIRRYSRGVKFNHRDQSWLKVCAKLGLIVLLDADFRAQSNNIFQPYDYDEGSGGKIQVKNIVIYGSRYLGEKPISALSVIRKAIKKDKGIFNILLLHFGVEGQMEHVPGVSLEVLEPLHHRIDYLALGHFHKQFIIGDWIFNPGSAEAACSTDFKLNRGIFLVEINGHELFKKRIRKIKLNNRKAIWKTVKIPYEFKNKKDFYSYIIRTLKCAPEWREDKIKPRENNLPFLILTLRGVNPFPNREIKSRLIQSVLNEELPIIGIRIYQRYDSKPISLENYL